MLAPDGSQRDIARIGESKERLSKENAQLTEQLTHVQTRRSELLNEVRELRRAAKKRIDDASAVENGLHSATTILTLRTLVAREKHPRA